MAFLLEKRSDNCERLRIELKTPSCKIGRKFVTSLSTYKNVSPVHAVLFFKDKSWYIQDLQSKFGVFVNFGQIGTKPVKLDYWNVIGFGTPVFNNAGFVAVLHPPSPENKNVGAECNSKIQLDIPILSYNCEDCVPKTRISSKMEQPEPVSTEGQTSVDLPLHKWKIDKYFQSTLPDERNEYQEHNMHHQNICNLSEACNKPSTSQSFDTQSNSSVESMNIIMYPSKSVLLEIEKSKKSHNKKLSNKHENDVPKKIQNLNSKNKKKISKKSLHQKLKKKKNISKEPSEQTKNLLKSLHKNLLTTNKTSLASCKTGMLESKTLEKPVPLNSKSDQSTVIKQKKTTVKKRAENYGSRTKFLLSDMQSLKEKSKQYKRPTNSALSNSSPKVTKQISSIKSNKDCKMSSTNNLTVPSSKLDQRDSKTQEISTDNIKTNSTTLEHESHIPKRSSMEFELAEHDPGIKLDKELQKIKRAENYGSRTKFLLSDMQSLKEKSKQYKRPTNSAVSNSSPKVTKQISSIKSNKDCKMSSMNNLTVPSSKLDQHDSKTQEISTDNIKTNCTTLEHKSHIPKRSSIEFELAKHDPGIKLDKESHLQQNILNNVPEVPEHSWADVSTKQHSIDASFDEKFNFSCSSRIESLDICSKNESNTIASHLETTKICSDKKLPEASTTSKSNKDNLQNSNNMCAIITSEDFCIKLIRIIVEFNPKWLVERYMNVEPPPDVSKGAKLLPLSFDSFDSYVSHLFPMLTLEVWEELSFYAKPILMSSSEKRFYFCILSHEYVHGMMLLNCESIVNEKVSFVPKKNNAVILHLKEIGGRDIPSFGFIKHHEFKKLDLNYVHLHKWQHLPENWIKSAKLYSCKIYTKCRILKLMDCLLEGNGICNLSKELMLSNTLNHLKSSPLIKDILVPTMSTFTVSYKQEKNCCDYNCIQENICSSVCEVMTLPPSVPKIILLQGPPGSGKTTAIARIAVKLYRDFNMKVLILAPSNFAVDEIGHQLVQLNEMADNYVHFIRLGSSKSPKLLLNLFESVLRLHQVKYEIEYLQYQHEMKMIEDKLHSLQGNQNVENWDEKYAQTLNELQLIQGKQLKKWDHSVEKNMAINILQNSKIILGTITDCFLYFKFKHSLKFSYCIIDEINQATELDALFPFALEINKFLLVGDPKQLAPVVKSKLALRCGFQRSILERSQLYFKMKIGFNPAIILTKQFRMQTQISDFPLQYFYSQDSKLCSYADKRSNGFPFKPYAIFHDITELRADRLFKYEMLGIEAVICFCSLFIKFHSSSSIAIIVPSEEEKEMYQHEVIKNFPRSAIEVDTLESFQGREKSIIILLCFKDISSGLDDSENIFCDERNLNVALTRAVNTLVICGPIHRFLKHKLWDVLIHQAQWQGCYTYYTHLNDYSRLFEEYLLKK